MSLCVESHLRYADENGYEVKVIKNATAAAGGNAYKATPTIYGFFTHESITAFEALQRLETVAA